MVDFLTVSGRLCLRTVCTLAAVLVVVDVAHSRPNAGSSSPLLKLSQNENLQKGLHRETRQTSHFERIVKRSVAKTVMEATKSIYTTAFYREIVPFVTDLKQNFKSDTPDTLDYVDTIPKILNPSDRAFQNGDVDYVVRQMMLAFDVTELLLEKVSRFVKNEKQSWLSKKKNSLKMALMVCKMSLSSLRLIGSSEEAAKAGMGGINNGVYNYMNSELLDKIIQLVSVLQSSS